MSGLRRAIDQRLAGAFGPLGLPVDLARATPHEMLAQRRRAIAYVSQFLRTVPRVK